MDKTPSTSGTIIEPIPSVDDNPFVNPHGSSQTGDGGHNYSGEDGDQHQDQQQNHHEQSSNRDSTGKSGTYYIQRLSKKSTSLRRKQKRKEPKSTPAALVKSQQQIEISPELAAVYPAHSPFFARMADGSIVKGIDWGRTTAFESRFTDPVDYDEMKEISMEALMNWVKESPLNREGKTLDQLEEEATKFIHGNPVQFICVYCQAKFTRLSRCKEHVFGKIRKKPYRANVCERRCEMDEINPDKVGLTSRPKRFPWAELILVDRTAGKSKTRPNGEIFIDFDVPNNIQQQWDELMIDEIERNQQGKSGRPRKQPEAEFCLRK